MSTKSAFSIGELGRKVCLAAEAQGYSPDLLNALAENPTLLSQMLKVQLGYAEVKLIKHVIDLDVDPFVPDGWKVEEHQRDGIFQWDPKRVSLYLSPNQRKSKSIEGNKLRKELDSALVLNANVLDYLIAHPALIPEEWKMDEKNRPRYNFIFFWGTIYRDSDGLLCVRYLYWLDGKWQSGFRWLDSGWKVDDPAALRTT